MQRLRMGVGQHGKDTTPPPVQRLAVGSNATINAPAGALPVETAVKGA